MSAERETRDVSPHPTGLIVPSWPRRQWLKMVAWIEDRPIRTLTLMVLLLGLGLFYAFRLNGLGHFQESFARWRIENFGGEHTVDRSVRSADLILSFAPQRCDRADVLSLVSLHFSGTAFRKDLEAFAARGGRIRIVTLDPKLSEPSHPHYERFVALGKAFGQDPLSFRARCVYMATVVVGLKDALGEALNVRVIDAPLSGADSPYFCLGRSTQLYFADDRPERTDLLAGRPTSPTLLDSFADPQLVIRNRPDHPDVLRFSQAFEEAWSAGRPLDESLRTSLEERLSL